jgi:hypothetical protein
MSASAPPRPLSRLRSLATLGLAAGILAGLVSPFSVPAAEALPGECRLETRWQSSGVHYDTDTDVYTETGIKGTSSVVCDVIDRPTGPGGGGVGPGGDGTGGGVTPPAPPGPPDPPGPLLPKPPASVPPKAGPPCVAGANNHTTPGWGGDGQTGDGDIPFQNIEEAFRAGDLRIDSTSPSRIVSMDVNIGPSMSGDAGANPFEGVDPDDVPGAMYSPNAYDPTITDVGWALKSLQKTAQLMMKAVTQGDLAANAGWRATWAKLPADKRQIVIDIVKTRIQQTQSAWKNDVPDSVKWVVEGLWEMLELAAEIPLPIDGAPARDPASVYMEIASASTTPGEAPGSNQGACGQVAKATVSSVVGVLPSSRWFRIELTGTTHGTLIDRIKALGSELTCPPVDLTFIAGQANYGSITDECSAPVTGVRLLDRREFSRLSADVKYGLRVSAAARGDLDPVAEGSLYYSRIDDFDGSIGARTSLLAPGHAGISGASEDGLLSYPLPLSAAGKNDLLVAMAKDAAGVEHPFIVRVAVKAPPTCDGADKVAGPDTGDFRAVIRDGAIQAVRNVPFTLDLKMLCTTDRRDTYRVTMTGDVPGTEPTVNPDGTITFDWTDPDQVGEVATLTFTAWDETTGAPSAPLEVPLFVRDQRPLCNDVEIEYDRSELAGAPLTIPIDCGMENGLKVINPAFLALGGEKLDTTVVEGGTFRSDGSAITFTPDDSGTELATTTVLPYRTNPLTSAHFYEAGKGFFIDVRMTD